VTNCTFYANSAPAQGGGIYMYQGATPIITNTILWGNQSLEGPQLYVGDSSIWSLTCSISHCDLEGGQAAVYVEPGSDLIWGAGMIDSDPLFADAGNEDLHLSYTSPCRETGDDSAPILPDEDYEGDPRSAYAGVDMGADEFYTHLYSIGNPTPGGNVEIKIIDSPGTTPVLLWLGSGYLDAPLPTVYGDWYLDFPLILELALGSIPAPDGIFVLPITLPPDTTAPLLLPLQAGVGDQLTNLFILRVE